MNKRKGAQVLTVLALRRAGSRVDDSETVWFGVCFVF